jgi:hypothetical protein
MPAVQASYGQMKLDLTELVIAAGIAFGAAVGLAEIVYSHMDIKPGWCRFSAVLTAAALIFLVIMLLNNPRDAQLLGFFALSLIWLLWLPPISYRIPLQPWQRRATIGVPALGLLGYAATTQGSQVGWFWYCGAALTAWACLTGWAVPGVARDAAASIKPRVAPRPPSAAAMRRMDRLFATWDTIGRRLGHLRQGAMSSTGALSRGVVVFLLCYAAGAAIVAIELPLFSELLLGAASGFPGAPSAPLHGGPVALAYWVSFGLLPTLLITALGWPWWRARGPN